MTKVDKLLNDLATLLEKATRENAELKKQLAGVTPTQSAIAKALRNPVSGSGAGRENSIARDNARVSHITRKGLFADHGGNPTATESVRKARAESDGDTGGFLVGGNRDLTASIRKRRAATQKRQASAAADTFAKSRNAR